jgi:hypothetical protein
MQSRDLVKKSQGVFSSDIRLNRVVAHMVRCAPARCLRYDLGPAKSALGTASGAEARRMVALDWRVPLARSAGAFRWRVLFTRSLARREIGH